ncbi:NAD(P)-binding domain-containing protein [Litorimonas haliclonae]
MLGGYGLIGLAVSKSLLKQGNQVTGLARSAKKGRKFLPEAAWISADISKLTDPKDWLEHLDHIDAVVNAAGILQNGLKDNVAATQRDSIKALIKACEQKGVAKFIQISAPGATRSAETLFYQTKAAADEALKKSRLKWTILRPGLVISPNAYGGTSLLRMLAAFPLIQPLVMPNARIQTISVRDVAYAVSVALGEDSLAGQDFDLVEEGSQTLTELILSFRAWLGFTKPAFVISVPNWVGGMVSKIADFAGWLGWRSSLRSTSLKVLTQNVTGDPAPWTHETGHVPQSLKRSLKDLPPTAQERLYARAKLLFPLLLITMSAFWLTSGVIGMFQQDKAVAILEGALPETTAILSVLLGSLIDIGIGLLVLFRPLTRFMSLFSILVAVGYLIASAVLTPHLWSDPLGPMVKVFPAIALALVIASLAEER